MREQAQQDLAVGKGNFHVAMVGNYQPVLVKDGFYLVRIRERQGCAVSILLTTALGICEER